MWLNQQQMTIQAIREYRKTLLNSTPHHLVIDQLFDEAKLQEVSQVLQQEQGWQTQQHTYSALYVDEAKWQKTPVAQRFVQRDVWQRELGQGQGSDGDGRPAQKAVAHPSAALNVQDNIALEFLQFLRGAEFMALLSRLFRVQITDIHVEKPELNTNYFRLGAQDFVNLHADDSPGREVCMLLYFNKDWQSDQGGELVFMGKDEQPVQIAPLFNRCVLFDPSSEGAEHWVNALSSEKNIAKNMAMSKTSTFGSTTANPTTSITTSSTTSKGPYRYNVTSWYWSE